jgi:heat shock protein HtpX
MPYTFVEIEATRGRRIVLLFATLLAVYLAGAVLVGMLLFFPLVSLGVLAGARSLHGPHEAFAVVRPLLVVVGVAVGATLLHWFLSLRGMVRRTLDLIGVQRLDPMDAYHRQLGNVVSEVAVATGGRRIEAVAVPARWLNAFAVADFRGRAVIGVSEGLLVRLDRDELEAVVGHEAAHLVAGDSLLSTVSCSMAAVWAGCLQALMPDRDDFAASEPSSRATGGSLPVLGVVALMRGLTYLLNAWLSREREYRADATAVRLTRNPLALAQALHTITGDSRRSLIAAGELAPLFVVGSSSSEAGGLSGMTSTHPPVERRIEILLGMAHAGPEALTDHTPRPAPANDVAVGPPAPPQRWFAREGLIWRGPFAPAELVALPWFGAFTPVSQGDARFAAPAWEQPEINRLLKRIDAPPTSLGGCPACGGALREVVYAGVPLHKCAACAGRLVTRERFVRVLARGQQPPSPEVHALAVQLVRERVARRGPAVPLRENQGPHRRCPACGAAMVPFLYQAILPHRITIDRCDPCGLLWFDGKELELIQDVLAIFGD